VRAIRTPGGPRIVALAGYCLISFLYFGLRLLVEPGQHYIGVSDDPQIPIWSFAWWPHAVFHGINPFVAHVIWSPPGVDLAWANTLPPVALALSPVTWAAGPVAAYNVAAIILPALSAWTAFLLCRHLTHRLWPSLLGGYLFGFSSYVLGHLAGQPQLTAVFCLPLVALFVLRFVEGGLSGKGLALRLGLVLGLQFYLALEVAFSVTLALVCALVLAVLFVPDRRRRVVAALRPILAAYGIAVVIAAPLVYYALTNLRRTGFTPPQDYVADLLNFVLPSHVEAAGAGWTQALHYAANDTEQGAFLGPLLVLVWLFAWQRRRRPGSRFLVACFVLAAYASLGPKLIVAGHSLIPLPTVFGHDSVTLPVVGTKSLSIFNNTLPARFAVYTSLTAAVAAAVWTASRRGGALTWALPAASVLLLFPNPTTWTTRYSIPAFFTSARYRPCLPAGANVLPEPVGSGGESNLWQVADAFRFRMAGGRLQTSPPSVFLHPPATAQISVGYPPVRNQAQLLRAYARRWGVTDAIVDPRQASIWTPALDRIATPHELGGIILYPLSGQLPPGCPTS